MSVSSSALLPGWLSHSLSGVILVSAGRKKQSPISCCVGDRMWFNPPWDQVPVVSPASHSPAHPHPARCLVRRSEDTISSPKPSATNLSDRPYSWLCGNNRIKMWTEIVMARTPPLTKKPRSPGEFPGEESRTFPPPPPHLGRSRGGTNCTRETGTVQEDHWDPLTVQRARQEERKETRVTWSEIRKTMKMMHINYFSRDHDKRKEGLFWLTVRGSAW